MKLIPNPADAGATVAVSGTGERRTPSRLYVRVLLTELVPSLAAQFKTSPRGEYNQTITAPASDAEVSLHQHRRGAWRQVDHAALAVRLATRPEDTT